MTKEQSMLQEMADSIFGCRDGHLRPVVTIDGKTDGYILRANFEFHGEVTVPHGAVASKQTSKEVDYLRLAMLDTIRRAALVWQGRNR